MDRAVRELGLEELAADDSLLITGPPMTGKYDLFRRILADTTDAVIVISTKKGANTVVEDIRGSSNGHPDGRIGVIDCVGQEGSPDQPDAVTKFVGSTGNLTGIGVKFTEVFDDFLEQYEDDRIGVGLHTASQLVMNADIERVYEFMQVLTGQVRSAGCKGVTVIDARVDNDDDLSILQHHFDAVLETRQGESGPPEFRVRGLGPTTTDWRPI